MIRDTVNIRNAINLAAGLIGMAFDQLEGIAAAENETPEADDLTEISGIGRAFAQRLNEAGILTYRQLGDRTSEQVREITRAAQWQGDPSAWISEAQELAGD